MWCLYQCKSCHIPPPRANTGGSKQSAHVWGCQAASDSRSLLSAGDDEKKNLELSHQSHWLCFCRGSTKHRHLEAGQCWWKDPGRTGHGLDRHIKHPTQATEAALGAWRSDTAARLRTEKRDTNHYHLVPVCWCLVIALGYSLTIHHHVSVFIILDTIRTSQWLPYTVSSLFPRRRERKEKEDF